jgi:hypothetical protein
MKEMQVMQPPKRFGRLWGMRLLLVLLISVVGWGQSGIGTLEVSGRREALYLTGADFIVPQLIIGGEWTSTLRLVNNGPVAITPHNAVFLDSEGRAMSATFQTTTGQGVVTSTGFTFFIAPGEMVEVTFFGGQQSQVGHIRLDASACPLAVACSLYGEVTLRNRNFTRPDFESVFALEAPARDQFLMWDHRDGFSTVLYLVNAGNDANGVSLDFWDTRNRLVRSVPVDLPGGGARILSLHALAPETLGLQGTLVIRPSNLVVATGLRINPSNSFTPLRTFVTKNQAR